MFNFVPGFLPRDHHNKKLPVFCFSSRRYSFFIPMISEEDVDQALFDLIWASLLCTYSDIVYYVTRLCWLYMSMFFWSGIYVQVGWPVALQLANLFSSKWINEVLGKTLVRLTYFPFFGRQGATLHQHCNSDVGF